MPVKHKPPSTISICYLQIIVNNKNMDKFKRQELEQNLIDSGCTQAVIEEFLLIYEQGRVKNSLRLLAKHRAELLIDLHNCQKKIDCLDYLIFNLKQQ